MKSTSQSTIRENKSLTAPNTEQDRTLVQLRDSWLNPKSPLGGPLPEADLKDRTLTKLYNQRPARLENAHRALDHAVFAAYGWPPTLTRDEILARLLALNLQRAAQQRAAEVPTKPKSTKPRKPPDRVVGAP